MRSRQQAPPPAGACAGHAPILPRPSMPACPAQHSTAWQVLAAAQPEATRQLRAPCAAALLSPVHVQATRAAARHSLDQRAHLGLSCMGPAVMVISAQVAPASTGRKRLTSVPGEKLMLPRS